MISIHDKPRRVRILGVLGVLCFVVSQWIAPLHIALNEHCVHGDAWAAAHADHPHDDHGHSHHHSSDESSPERDGDEAPHPVEDHFDDLGDPGVVPPSEPLLACPGELTAPWQCHLDPLGEELSAATLAPRPPPPPERCAPRAPPICI